MDDMTCAFCDKTVNATWLVAMGSAECTNVIEYLACDVHADVLRKAAVFAEDECDPPHRIDEIMLWDAETKREPETIYPQHEKRDIPSLVTALVPQRVECEECGKRHPTVAAANRCKQKDRAAVASFKVMSSATVVAAMVTAGCKDCKRVTMVSPTTEMCATCITRRLGLMVKKMKDK